MKPEIIFEKNGFTVDKSYIQMNRYKSIIVFTVRDSQGVQLHVRRNSAQAIQLAKEAG